MKIKALTEEAFWPLLRKEEKKVFDAPTFAAHQHLSAHEKSTYPNRKKFVKDRVELYYGLFDEKNKFVGWSASIQMRPNELYMINSAVLPKFQRKGWYTKLAKTVLAEAKRLGFQIVVSNHVASNNPILIAKLKLGFVINGIEVHDEMGVLLKLTYFLNPLRGEVMRYRTGEVYPSPRVKKILRLK